MAWEAFLILLRFKLHCMHMALIFDGCEDTGHETLVFLFEYCSDLLWEKIVLLFSDRENTFEIRGWRLGICKIFEITRTIFSNSERSEQFLVTEWFFNLFLEVSQIQRCFLSKETTYVTVTRGTLWSDKV